MPDNKNAAWIETPESSNVHSFRWVGGSYGLEVRFKKKDGTVIGHYGYAVPHFYFTEMKDSASKGIFVNEKLKCLVGPQLRRYS